ncbi:MAG: hypothetical protein EPO23_01370 [Xanthobacteraceae bacterium]|nr:MAG: hypothetical protein EPO23_01370 [Xanthobacteraceae bacterium]
MTIILVSSRLASLARPLAAVALVLATTAALAQMAPAKPGTSAKGPVMVDAKGMTLYTFDRDASGKSACTGPCTENWPPLMAGADAQASGDWSVIARPDGKKQWAYKGKPLYAWKNDKAPGETSGDGFNGLWHMATP